MESKSFFFRGSFVVVDGKSSMGCAGFFSALLTPQISSKIWVNIVSQNQPPKTQATFYWVLDVTHATLPNLVSSCVPAGFPHVFDHFWYFWMWGDVLKVCVPAVFGEGWRCWRLDHMASGRHQSLCGRLWNVYIFQRKFRSQTSDNLERWKAEKRRVEERTRKEIEESRYRCAKC